MSAPNRFIPVLIASGVGVISGMYIWRVPLQEVTGKGPAPGGAPTEGRSQSVKDGKDKEGPSSFAPHAPLKHGGANPNPAGSQTGTVAGTSSSAIKGYSADHSPAIRSNPKEQDGSSGGGNGLAEMRERKMEGRGLPSPQGGDTPAKPVEARMADGEGGGIKKKQNGRWWLGGW